MKSTNSFISFLIMWTVSIVLAVTAAEHDEGGEEGEGAAAPYGGSYQIEDTCQFSLCGPLYRQEFGVGRRPLAGSCSGDCHLLAINTNTNRFTREFLWSHCATMCSAKYNTTQFRSEVFRIKNIQLNYTFQLVQAKVFLHELLLLHVLPLGPPP